MEELELGLSWCSVSVLFLSFYDWSVLFMSEKTVVDVCPRCGCVLMVNYECRLVWCPNCDYEDRYIVRG